MGVKTRLARLYFPERLATRAVERLPVFSGVVLMYHEVLPDDVDLPAWTILRESDFRWQMQYLGRHFDVVSMDEAFRRVCRGGKASRPFAVVTFDDGYKGNFHTVLPLMEDMGLPFIVYVATQGVLEKKLFWYDRIICLLASGHDLRIDLSIQGKNRRFTVPANAGPSRRWDSVQRLLTCLKQMPPEVRESSVENIVSCSAQEKPLLEMLDAPDVKRLADSSCATIGSHTHRHELLDQVSPEGVRDTILTAEKCIADITGSAPVHFAYPNGNFNLSVQKQVMAAGYKTAVTTIPGFWSGEEQRLRIPRMGIGRFETKSGFKARVGGFL